MSAKKSAKPRVITRVKSVLPRPKVESMPSRTSDFKRDTEAVPGAKTEPTCLPPRRKHAASYHTPIILPSPKDIQCLLSWFNKQSSSRSMPWRKPFLSSSTSSPAQIQIRAYEIWISEIMLQQTRVSTVIPYWERWIKKWPTIQDLAQADLDEVLAAWKGLGYYSRATRLQEAARQIVDDFGGVLPQDVEDLKKVKGIGAYTAGAVGSIAFGKAVPLLDGNVARVLSRQVGLYARVKDKKVDDRLWKLAGALVRAAAGHEKEEDVSEVPGLWNQGLMELGATICTPRPKCEDCPIQGSCRAFAEGQLFVSKQKQKMDQIGEELLADIEDSCQLCSPLELEEVEEANEHDEDIQITKSRKRAPSTTKSEGLPLRPSKRSKQTTLAFAPAQGLTTNSKTILHEEETEKPVVLPAKHLSQIKTYCALFPQKPIKKAIPTEEHLICIVKQNNTAGETRFLLEQRPPKGLLANLWEFPTLKFASRSPGEESKTETKASEENRDVSALDFARGMLTNSKYSIEIDRNRGENGRLGQLVHIFSHLKVEMHVYSFSITNSNTSDTDLTLQPGKRQKWLTAAEVEVSTLGTGMQKCWTLYNKSQ